MSDTIRLIFLLFIIYPSTNAYWQWFRGENYTNVDDFLGTKNEPSTKVSVGCRMDAGLSYDYIRNVFYLHGGITEFNKNPGSSSDSPVDYSSVFMKYDVGIDQWTWLTGSSKVNVPSYYGYYQVPDTKNYVGARAHSQVAFDSENNKVSSFLITLAIFVWGVWGGC
jgi:hypothetical protein